MGDRLDVAAEAEDQYERQSRVDGTRYACRSSGANVGQGSQGVAGARHAAEHAGDHVAEALANEFTVGVVTGAGDRIGDERREQAVHGAEQSQNQGRFQRAQQERRIRQHQGEGGHAKWVRVR